MGSADQSSEQCSMEKSPMGRDSRFPEAAPAILAAVCIALLSTGAETANAQRRTNVAPAQAPVAKTEVAPVAAFPLAQACAPLPPPPRAPRPIAADSAQG